MATENPQIQSLLDRMQEAFGISEDFVSASDHPRSCRCSKCLEWWATIGPDGEEDDVGAWGPFTLEEIKEYQEETDDNRS